MMKNNNIEKEPITNAYEVSGMIIKVHNDNNKRLDLLKLLKLLYICFGYISAKKQQYLFGERIEAWQLGPVVPKVYFHVRYYTSYEEDYKIGEIQSDKVNSKMEIPKNIEETYDYINAISKHYFKRTSFELINITHAMDSPWDKIYDGTPRKEIPKEEIVKYYINLLK